MALEAKRRKRRTTRRRRTYSASLSPRKRTIHRRRRRSSLREEGTLSARGGYGNLAMQFLEAGAGGIAAKIVGRFLPIQNIWIKSLAGAGISVLTATQLKRPILGAGMASVFAGDLLKSFNLIPGLAEMEETDFLNGELSQPQMVYLSPSGEPVFMAENGSMLYADGSESGLSYQDYE